MNPINGLFPSLVPAFTALEHRDEWFTLVVLPGPVTGWSESLDPTGDSEWNGYYHDNFIPALKTVIEYLPSFLRLAEAVANGVGTETNRAAYARNLVDSIQTHLLTRDCPVPPGEVAPAEENPYYCRICAADVAEGEGDFDNSPPIHFSCAREQGIPTYLDEKE
jgi:hypothetical protein